LSPWAGQLFHSKAFSGENAAQQAVARPSRTGATAPNATKRDTKASCNCELLAIQVGYSGLGNEFCLLPIQLWTAAIGQHRTR
jgi:hypothetical protein